jgi:hypothetical protein
VHYISGSGAAVASALTAATITTHPAKSLCLAMSAAVFAFIQTVIKPGKEAARYVRAYRHLEKKMAEYRLNPDINDRDLGQAESEAIGLLEREGNG